MCIELYCLVLIPLKHKWKIHLPIINERINVCHIQDNIIIQSDTVTLV